MTKRLFYISLILILMLSSFFAGVALRSLAEEKIATLADFELIWEVIHLIDDEFVKKIDNPKEIVYGAIRGMLKSLDDEYTRFMEPKAYQNMKIETKGEFGGIGIQIGIKKVKINTKREEERIVVIAPIEGTPAYKVGLKSGDWIIKVDGKSTIDVPLEEVVTWIRGEVGTKVTLTIKREEVKEELEFSIIREIIKIETIQLKKVKYVDKENGIGYIRIEGFNQETPNDLKNAIKKLKKEGELNGLVLDLRYNPGGLLDSAVRVCDEFLPAGRKIVQIKSREEGKSNIIYSTPNLSISNIPVVTLVNGYSASGSEIVAGCLQDNKKSVIISSRYEKDEYLKTGNTFGKGSVQTVHPLRDNSAVVLTTAYYLTAEGRDINRVGIIPDRIVELKELPKSEDLGEVEKDVQLSEGCKVLIKKLSE